MIMMSKMISYIKNHNEQNKKEMMGVTKALVIGAAMMLGLAATLGWLSQEAEAAKCLDCDERITNEVSGAEPACIYGIFSCPPWAGGHNELTADSAFFCPDCREYPIP